MKVVQKYLDNKMMMRRFYIGIHDTFLAQVIIEGVLCVEDMPCSFVCLEHRLSFSSRVQEQSLTTANQRRTLTYFKSWLYVKDLGPPVVDGIWTHNFWFDNLCLTNSNPPLVANLKALNWFQAMDSQTLWRSFPVINISKSHVFIYHSWFATAISRQLLNRKSMRKSWSHVFCQQRVMVALQLDDYCIT